MPEGSENQDKQQDGGDEAPPLSIIVDRSLFTFTELVQLYKVLDDLYASMSDGDHLQIVESNSIQITKKPASKFDQHKGTQWSSAEKSAKHIPLSPDVTRKEVHDAIESLISPEQQQVVRSDLERKFPAESWGEKYPSQSALQALLEALIEESNN